MSDENEIFEEIDDMPDETAGPVVVSAPGLDFEHAKMLALYGNGMPASDIAAEMGYANPCTVYGKLKEFPSQYADAKRKLAEIRAAKHRRNESLSVDILTISLENMKNLLSRKDEIKDTLKEKRAKLIELTTNDPSAFSFHAFKLKQEVEELESLLDEISEIDLKAVNSISDTASKRADFGEGLATDRHEIGGINGQPLPAFNVIIKRSNGQ